MQDDKTVAMAFTIEYAESVTQDLKPLRKIDRKLVLDAIDEQLSNEPTRETRNRKILVGLKPPWEHLEPVWELRVGEFRVFYDVDSGKSLVIIRAIRHKPPHKTTEEIL